MGRMTDAEVNSVLFDEAWELRKRVAELEAALPQWQPIETAPKDGTQFICYFTQMKRGVKHHIGWFGPSITTGELRFFLYGAGEFLSPAIVPTHWMPLPQPPGE